ncbi:MBL fold metallo-hydrolase [Desulfospira joergensenii]|uniref:MBL fold metallo-hydrolase n=1 Tax=Desulfospira joergensenii TaxID=53329 RepID=UPI0003B67115|nr:MBL fold metallo-hydrolase [Desulfospira joergensenii]
MKKIQIFHLCIALIWFTLFYATLGCATQKRGAIHLEQEKNSVGSKSESKKPEHHTESGFQNFPVVPMDKPSLSFYLRRFWHSIFLHDVPDEHYLSETQAINLRNSISGDNTTWIGHATFLIRISGMTILTDPFLSKYASPFSWGGPRRMLPPGISLDNLPPIDILIVSHNHYDHLDDVTIRKLQDKDKIQVIVPLGLKPFFKERGYTHVSELDWYDEIKINDIKFSSLPAVHHSGRNLSDHNKTLWSSWAISSSNKKLYFSGDSAYSEIIFKKNGEEFGPFDYAFVPIGAYEPKKTMKTHHMNPEEAVTTGKDLQAMTLIASHWGTINLSDEPPWEPPKRFHKAGIDNGLMENNIWVMKIGETRPLEGLYLFGTNKKNKAILDVKRVCENLNVELTLFE